MDVSIIIVNYNTIAITKQCINSIVDKTHGCTYEIIVVDNGSCDNSVEELSHDERIIFVEASNNLGFGKANNLGIKYAMGKYLLFLNSDTYLLNDAVTCFYEFCESHSNMMIGGVGALLKNPDGNTVHSFSRFPTLGRVLSSFYIYPFYKLFGKKYKRYDTTSSDQTRPFFKVHYVTGADLFVNRDIVDKYGAFDPDFFMYYEESEMQNRWSKKGFESYIVKSPQIVHLEGYTAKQGGRELFHEKKFYWSLESNIIYFHKCHSTIYYILCRIALLSNFLPIFRGKYNISQIIKMTKILFSICH